MASGNSFCQTEFHKERWATLLPDTSFCGDPRLAERLPVLSVSLIQKTSV